MSVITQAPATTVAHTLPRGTLPRAEERETHADGSPRILLLRALGLGDFLTGVPAYRAVKRAFPQHEVVLAAPGQFADLVELTGAIDRLLPTEELAPVRWPWPYQAPELAVDLHGNGPASRVLLERLRPSRVIGFGIRRAPNRGVCHLGPRWLPGEHEVNRWCRLLTRSGIPADPADLDLLLPDVNGDGDSSGSSDGDGSRTRQRAAAGPWPGGFARPIIIHPGAAYASRRWPAARFAAVAGYLNKSGWRVLVTGSPSERDLAEYIVRTAGLPPHAAVAGQTTPLALASIVAQAALVVSGDTGVAHLATAFRRPSVVLFGPIPPQEWGPPPDRPWHVALHAAEPGYHGDPHGDEVDPALGAIRATDVIAAVDKLLDATAHQ